MESLAEKKKRVLKIIQTLKKNYPNAECALTHDNPLQLLVATILSAQCTDVRVNKVTPALFKKYKTAHDFACAKTSELEALIRTTGFFRSKAKSIIHCCQSIEEKFGGKVPQTMEDLVQLRGVGRKTANVVLGNAYGIPGLVVDTHVGRISRLLKLTKNSDPVKIEMDLNELVPQKEWTQFSHLLILHGRAICVARRPWCSKCPISYLCPSSGIGR
jgi:endonuclease-3